MRKVVETFTYEVPEDCDDFITVQDYILASREATCPFYDDLDSFVPEISRTIEIKENDI